MNISKVSVDFIELTNESGIELNLSWWKLRAGKESFTIPKNTLILAGKILVFSNKVTKLAVSEPYNVALLYPNGAEAFYYKSDASSNEKTSTGVVKMSKVSTDTINTTEEKETVVIKNTESVAVKTPVEEGVILENGQNLGDTQIASPLPATTKERGENTGSPIYKWLLALVSIISVAAIGVLLTRRQESGEEIEILD